jgi:hypothetical protein
MLGACSTEKNQQADSPTSVGPRSVVPAPDGTAQESSPGPTGVGDAAVAVYKAMWDDVVAAATTADFQSPRLADHAASQALLLLSGSLRKANQQSLVIRGKPTLSPHVTAVAPSTRPVAVSILDCVDDSRWLNYTRDGRLQNKAPGGKHRTTATVGLLGGQWLVTRLQIGEVGTCQG